MHLKWDPRAIPAGTQGHLLILLRPFAPGDAAKILAGEFNSDLLRVPVTPDQGHASAFVPAHRPVSLLLVFRDAKNGGVNPGQVQVLPIAAAIRPAPPKPSDDSDASGGCAFVFVDDSGAPDLHKLASRVAAHFSGKKVPKPPLREGGAFGTKQRWTLSRLTWVPTPKAPLRLIVRPTFIESTEINQWEDALPTDARAMPPGTDGLIDATTPAECFAFYCVLEGPAPWRALPLTPLLPPFSGIKRLHSVGKSAPVLSEAFQTLRTKLETEAIALHRLEGLGELWTAAVAHLPAESPLRVQVDAWVQDMRTTLPF